MISSGKHIFGYSKVIYNKSEFRSWQNYCYIHAFQINSFITSSYLPLFWGDVEGEKVQESLKLGLGDTTSVPLALWGREQKKLTYTTSEPYH